MTSSSRRLLLVTIALSIFTSPAISLAQKTSTGTTTNGLTTERIRGGGKGNRAPTISGTPAPAVVAGSAYGFTPVASDPEGSALSFTISNRPAWATFSAASGQLQGTPQLANAGTYNNIVISVSDGRKTAALAPFGIVVTAPQTAPTATNAAPTITGTPATSAKQGTQYVFQPTAADVNGDPLTFTIANRPAWATFNNNTGALVGTPTTTSVGTFGSIVLSVSDGKASTSLPAFAITVASANAPPTITGTPSTTATVGTPYAFAPSANDVNGGTLTFSIVNKPVWATFTSSTGRLQGTPAAANVGTFSNIVIAVSDGQASTQLSAFAITVSAAPNTAPTISGAPAPSVMSGTQYAFQPTANDVDGDALTFSISNKPAWATFTTSTGRLQGTPGAGDVGTTSGVVIAVTDGKASAALPAFGVTVQATANGSATLTWLPPTENTDGSALTNLAGYKVYWGSSQGNYPNSTTLNNAGLTSYVVENLVPGIYFFAVTAVNATGAESQQSNSATKTIP